MKATEIGAVLEKVRREQGMTLEALGKKSGVTPKSIGRYEAGYVIPRRSILEKLAAVLPLPLAEMARASYLYHENQRLIRHDARSQCVKRGLRRKSLPSQLKLAAVIWAANREGMSYGHFVAQTPQDEDTYKEIYQAYQAHLKEGCLCR